MIARFVRLLEKAEALLDLRLQIARDEMEKRKWWPYPAGFAPLAPPPPTANPTPWQPFQVEPIDQGITWRCYAGDPPNPYGTQSTIGWGPQHAACGGGIAQGETFTTTIGGAS